ncbi:MAG: ester cyclase [Sandaracinaceae bacterium]
MANHDAAPTRGPLQGRPPAELFRQLFEEVLNRRDADALMPYWAEDIVEEFPDATCRGREEVRDYFAAMFAAMPDFAIEARRIVGDDTTVFVHWHSTGTFSGAPYKGVEPTGDRVELEGMDCFTLRDGLIVHNKVVFDQLGFGRQIGLFPGADSPVERAMTAFFNLGTRLRRLVGAGRVHATPSGA